MTGVVTPTPTTGRPASPGSHSRLLMPVAAALLGLATIAFVLDHWSWGEDPIALAPLPQCTTRSPQLTILVPDVSDSVIASGGADPKGRSFEEAKLLAAHLADYRCSTDDRFAAVIFASNAVEVPAIPLDSLSVIEAVMQRPPATEIGDGTRLVPALERVRGILARNPEHDAVVVVLSDMVAEPAEQLAPALDEIGRYRLHLVALGQHDQSFDQHFSSVTLLDGAPRGQVAEALNDIISTHRKAESS